MHATNDSIPLAGWVVSLLGGATSCNVTLVANGVQPYLRHVLLVGLTTDKGTEKAYLLGPDGNTLQPAGTVDASAAGEETGYSANPPAPWATNKTMPIQAPDGEAILSIAIVLRDLSEPTDARVELLCPGGVSPDVWASNEPVWQGIFEGDSMASADAGGPLAQGSAGVQGHLERHADETGMLALYVTGDLLSARGMAGTMQVSWPGGREEVRLMPGSLATDTIVGGPIEWKVYRGGAGDYEVSWDALVLEPTGTVFLVWLGD